MPNILKTASCIITLLLVTTSLAASCAPGDTDCELAQKKIELMEKAGIKPINTKNVPTPDDTKKPSGPMPFQIPKPETESEAPSQNGSNQQKQIVTNPGLKLSQPTPQNKTPEFQFQQPKTLLQLITPATNQSQSTQPINIYR